MATTAKVRSRPARSNSLQRMLELEKQCMLERRHAQAATNTTSSTSTSSSPRSVTFSPSDLTVKPLQPRVRAPAGVTGDTGATAAPGVPGAPTGGASAADPHHHPAASAVAVPPRGRIPAAAATSASASASASANTFTPSPMSRRDSNDQSMTPGAKDSAPAPLQPHQPHQRRHHNGAQPPPQLPPLSTNVSFSSGLVFDHAPYSPSAATSPAKAKGARASPAKVDLPDPAMPPTQTQHKGTIPQRVSHETSPVVVQVIDDHRSVCQSPSWEAYDRRKKDKKREKAEQAEKLARPRKRRLSKEPPPSSVPASPSFRPTRASRGASVNAQIPNLSLSQSRDSSPGPRQQPRSRSGSAISLYSPVCFPPDVDSSAATAASTHWQQQQKPRSRSSSFTSLIKAPFEVRRPSFDRGAEPGFIGGIKLEQHLIAAHQSALNDQAILTEADLHPAFRKRERRSSSPLRFPVFGPRSDPKDPQKRAYPPISIRTSSSKNHALLAPEVISDSEDSMMQKLRARVGLKTPAGKDSKTSNSKKNGRRLSKLPAPPQDEAIRKIMAGKNLSTPTLNNPWGPTNSATITALRSEENDLKSLRLEPASGLGLELDSRIDPGSLPPFAPRPKPGDAGSRYGKTDDDASFETSSPTMSADTLSAPEYPPPPAPPRKSSKRKSLISLNDMESHLPRSGSQTTMETAFTAVSEQRGADSRRMSQTSPSLSSDGSPRLGEEAPPASPRMVRPRRESMCDPPSISYDSLTPGSNSPSSAQPRRTFREAARAAFGLDHSAHHAGKRDTSQSRPPQAHAGLRKSISVNPLQVNNNSNHPDWSIPHVIPHHHKSPPTQHSSEDSCSDDLNSPSFSGTPDSSRPASEKEFPTSSAAKDVGQAAETKSTTSTTEYYARHQALRSAAPSPAFTYSDSSGSPFGTKPPSIDLDPIQAAAMKVLAAFPDVPPKRGMHDRRSNSDTNLIRGSFQSKGKFNASPLNDRARPSPPRTITLEPPNSAELGKAQPIRDLIMSKDESSVAAPWPASYLEAARKAAPPPPKSQKPAAAAAAQPAGDGVAKMFVECCSCKYYHDMPSKVYEGMANVDGPAGASAPTVPCQWCKHDMTTKCCAGLAAMVYVKERLH